MIIPAIFNKQERTDIKNNNNYICCTDEYSDITIINVFDKREQRIIHNVITIKEKKYNDFIDIVEIYDLNNIEFLEKIHNDIFESCIEEDSIIFDIINKFINKIPSIKLHIKRIAQIYEYLDKYNLNLELESKFNKNKGISYIYLYNENAINRYNQINITYNYINGLFTYINDKKFINSSYFLEQLFININYPINE